MIEAETWRPVVRRFAICAALGFAMASLLPAAGMLAVTALLLILALLLALGLLAIVVLIAMQAIELALGRLERNPPRSTSAGGGRGAVTPRTAENESA